MSRMNFTLQTQAGEQRFELEYERVFAIGYAGRNLEKTMEHIRELERDLGVPAPKKIPTIFQCGNYLLTQEKDLVFVGEKICAKPICPVLWEYEEIRDHWDQILLRSWQTLGGTETAYQEGSLADILPPDVILKELNERVGEIDNCVIFSGTVPVLNGFHYGTNFRYEMEDPVLGRKLCYDYDVIAISEEER